MNFVALAIFDLFKIILELRNLQNFLDLSIFLQKNFNFQAVG